jgi:hypothetical protein
MTHEQAKAAAKAAVERDPKLFARDSQGKRKVWCKSKQHKGQWVVVVRFGPMSWIVDKPNQVWPSICRFVRAVQRMRAEHRAEIVGSP